MKPSLFADGFEEVRLWDSVIDLLSANELCSIATTTPDGRPYINTCFFAFDPNLRLYVLTPPAAQHSRNIEARPDISVAIFDSHQKSGAELRGLQIFGRCFQAVNPDDLKRSFEAYADRFEAILTSAPNVEALLKVFESRLFTIEPTSIKIFDEPTFGKEVWITAKVGGA